MGAGLCSPDEFKDSDGFGLISHATGQASHRLFKTAIESLTCMAHCGGIAGDMVRGSDFVAWLAVKVAKLLKVF